MRDCGISLAPAPVIIVDPEFDDKWAYYLERALMSAMTITPANTVDLQPHTRYTELCVPVMMCRGLCELGTNVAEEREVMLRALIPVVHRVTQEMGFDHAKHFARTHKTESVEILGNVATTRPDVATERP